jgi:hypothetical protein
VAAASVRMARAPGDRMSFPSVPPPRSGPTAVVGSDKMSGRRGHGIHEEASMAMTVPNRVRARPALCLSELTTRRRQERAALMPAGRHLGRYFQPERAAHPSTALSTGRGPTVADTIVALPAADLDRLVYLAVMEARDDGAVARRCRRRARQQPVADRRPRPVRRARPALPRRVRGAAAGDRRLRAGVPEGRGRPAARDRHVRRRRPDAGSAPARRRPGRAAALRRAAIRRLPRHRPGTAEHRRLRLLGAAAIDDREQPQRLPDRRGGDRPVRADLVRVGSLAGEEVGTAPGRMSGSSTSCCSP